MGFFDFFKNKRKDRDLPEEESVAFDKLSNESEPEATSNEIEFLIAGDIDVFDDWDNIMTPNTFAWEKVERNNWTYYKIGEDEVNYSMEPPGIQMIFNKGVKHEKARAIAQEVTQNIKATGQSAELVEINPGVIYKFE
jgi:hypothetical protein